MPVVASTVSTDRLRVHRSAPPSSGGSRWTSSSEWVRRAFGAVRGLSPQWRDVLLYGCSALFAGVTAFVVGIPLYRQWGQMAVGFYALATVLMALVAWRVSGRPTWNGSERSSRGMGLTLSMANCEPRKLP